MKFHVKLNCVTKFVLAIATKSELTVGLQECFGRQVVETKKDIDFPAGFKFTELREVDPGSYAVDEVDS